MYRLGSAQLASTKQLTVVSTAIAITTNLHIHPTTKLIYTRCTNLPVAQRTNVITRRETMRILRLVFRRSVVSRLSFSNQYMCVRSAIYDYVLCRCDFSYWIPLASFPGLPRFSSSVCVQYNTRKRKSERKPKN